MVILVILVMSYLDSDISQDIYFLVLQWINGVFTWSPEVYGVFSHWILVGNYLVLLFSHLLLSIKTTCLCIMIDLCKFLLFLLRESFYRMERKKTWAWSLPFAKSYLVAINTSLHALASSRLKPTHPWPRVASEAWRPLCWGGQSSWVWEVYRAGGPALPSGHGPCEVSLYRGLEVGLGGQWSPWSSREPPHWPVGSTAYPGT